MEDTSDNDNNQGVEGEQTNEEDEDYMLTPQQKIKQAKNGDEFVAAAKTLLKGGGSYGESLSMNRAIKGLSKDG